MTKIDRVGIILQMMQIYCEKYNNVYNNLLMKYIAMYVGYCKWAET